MGKDYLAKIKKYKSVVFGLGQVIKGVRSNKIQFKNKMITHIASIDGLQRKLAKLRQSIARGKRACGEQIRGSFLARLNGAAEQVVVANPQVQAVAKPISVLVKRKAIGADLVVPVHGIENNLLLGNGANHKKAKKRRVIPSLGKVADILGISFEQTSEDVMSLASHPESRPSKRPGTAHDAVADTAVTLRVMNSLYKDPYKVARKISAALGWGD